MGQDFCLVGILDDFHLHNSTDDSLQREKLVSYWYWYLFILFTCIVCINITFLIHVHNKTVAMVFLWFSNWASEILSLNNYYLLSYSVVICHILWIVIKSEFEN